MHAPHKRQLLEMALTRLSTLLDAESRVHALLRHDSYRAPVAPKAFKCDSCRAPRWTDPVMFAFVSDVPADRHLQATSRSVPREPFHPKFETHTRPKGSKRPQKTSSTRPQRGVFAKLWQSTALYASNPTVRSRSTNFPDGYGSVQSQSTTFPSNELTVQSLSTTFPTATPSVKSQSSGFAARSRIVQ